VEEPYRVPPSIRIGNTDWPLFALLGGFGTAAAWLVVVVQDAPTRYAGLAWLAGGFALYSAYRRRAGLPLSTTARAPIQLGPAVALEYRTILVPIVSGPESHESVDLAARLAAERGATIVALRVIVVPLDQPLDVDLREQEAERRQAEIIVLGAPRGRHRDIFGKTVDYVLKNAPCRVMIAAGKKAA